LGHETAGFSQSFVFNDLSPVSFRCFLRFALRATRAESNLILAAIIIDDSEKWKDLFAILSIRRVAG
jgi:hypothetical protein